jgi:sugar phosphate permease
LIAKMPASMRKIRKHRYWVLAIVLCAWTLCYMDRMVIASAIPFMAEELHLSPTTMGVVMSAFFAGYALMQIPGGLLADRFGPRAVLAFSIAWFSVMTALTGFAQGLISLLMIRVLFGLGEGPFPAAASKTLSIWFPPRELGRANGFTQAATALGATLAPLFVAAFIASWSWRIVFYSLFIPGIALGAAIWWYVRNSPADSRYVTSEEMKEYDTAASPALSSKENLLESLRSPAVRWCAASLFLANTVAWGLMNWLPTYLLQARGFSVEKMGLFAAITNLAGAAGYLLGGYVCDKYFSQNLRIPITFGLLASAGLTYLAAGAPTGEWAVLCLAMVFLLSNISFVAIFTVPLLTVPKHRIGGAFGIVNTAGQLSGVLAPVAVGYVLSLTHSDFKAVLYCMVGLALLAAYPAMRIRQPTIPAVVAR